MIAINLKNNIYFKTVTIHNHCSFINYKNCRYDLNIYFLINEYF